MHFFLGAIAGAAIPLQALSRNNSQELELTDSAYFAKPGVNVLMFSNWYNGMFSDAKMSSIEMIHHGERTATNGDVRLNPTPGQWHPPYR